MRYRWLIIAAACLVLAGALYHLLAADAPLPVSNVTGSAELGLMLTEEAGGVSVLAVQEKSNADRAGVFPGDWVLQANDTPFSTVHELDEILRRLEGSTLSLRLMRAGETVMVQLACPPLFSSY